MGAWFWDGAGGGGYAVEPRSASLFPSGQRHERIVKLLGERQEALRMTGGGVPTKYKWMRS